MMKMMEMMKHVCWVCKSWMTKIVYTHDIIIKLFLDLLMLPGM